MKEIRKKIVALIILGTVSLAGTIASASVNVLEIDFENMNGHSVVKMDEGFKNVIKLKVINYDGDLTYNISGGADKDLFEFNSDNLILKFKNIADFENPKDSDLNNIYRISLKIKDEQKEMRQSFWIHIEDVQYFKKETKNYHNKGGIRTKRNMKTCKDSRALNFSARGQHEQDLCIYKVEKSLEVEINNSNIVKNEEKKTTIKDTPNKIVFREEKDKLAKIEENKNEKINNELALVELKEGEEELAKKDDEENNNQTASLLESKIASGVKTSNQWSFLIFAFLILVAIWLIWKIFKKENDNIDRL